MLPTKIKLVHLVLGLNFEIFLATVSGRCIRFDVLVEERKVISSLDTKKTLLKYLVRRFSYKYRGKTSKE
jgi:hypothetical protein